MGQVEDLISLLSRIVPAILGVATRGWWRSAHLVAPEPDWGEPEHWDPEAERKWVHVPWASGLMDLLEPQFFISKMRMVLSGLKSISVSNK